MTTKDSALRLPVLAMATIAAVLIAIVIAGCGGGDDKGKSSTEGNRVDAAFARDMIDHHRGAIEMAEIAQNRAEHSEVKNLADEIIEAQRSEIALMTRIGDELKAHGQKASSLGMSHAQMGMAMEMPMLERAKPFDRAFLEMMIPHHRGAVAMAKVLLEKGSHGELRRLGRRVIDDQTAEIKKMQGWLKDWYGVEPSGDESGTMMNHEGMNGGGM